MFDFKDNIFDRPVNLSWEHSMLLAAVLSGTGKKLRSFGCVHKIWSQFDNSQKDFSWVLTDIDWK